MPAPLLIAGASFLFAVMGLCVKLASAQYTAGEIVFYRSLIGLVLLGVLLRARGVGLRTPVPALHFWRGLCGVGALCLWFFALGGLPLATAMTMNYMSSVWMALFLLGGAVLLGSARVDGRLVAAVLAGFGGVALILRPTVDQQQVWHGLAGLASGMLSAMAYLQVTALGRAGEPETRVVFYFSLGGVLAGGAIAAASGGFGAHSAQGLALLLAIGLCAAAAQLMMTRAYTIGSALTNATLQYLGIVFAVLFGVWIFDDPLSLPTLAGIGLIVGAGITATLIGAQAKVPRAPPET
jgi:drug/metabolite transporter (DMT)-like permease